MSNSCRDCGGSLSVSCSASEWDERGCPVHDPNYDGAPEFSWETSDRPSRAELDARQRAKEREAGR